MNKTMCPGQDTRFWQPGDIFNSRCGNCGNVIEFFKDDASQRCKKCGTRVQNPKLNMGCAQWCEHAKDCLGYDPKDKENTAATSENLGYDISLADRILGELKQKFGEKSRIYIDALKYRDKAEQLIDVQGGRPRIIIPAAILYSAYINLSSNPSYGQTLSDKNKNSDITVKILKETGLDSLSIDEIVEIIDFINDNKIIDSNEYKIVSSVASSFQTQQ